MIYHFVYEGNRIICKKKFVSFKSMQQFVIKSFKKIKAEVFLYYIDQEDEKIVLFN